MSGHGVERPLQALRALLVWLLLGFVMAGGASAHKGSDAYLDVRQLAPASTASDDAAAELRLVLSVALRDLDQVVPVDANSDARITWGEVRAATPAMLQQLDRAVQFESAAERGCALRWQRDGLEQRGDGVYFRAAAVVRCPRAVALNLRYRLFREQDADHRLLLAGHVDGVDLLSAVSPQQQATVPLRTAALRAADAGRWPALRDYFLLGMHHLLEGYDHLAFLLALVLPLQLRLLLPGWGAGRPHAPADAAGNWGRLLRTVTAFTVGHSITLVLATLGWTQASPGWVEPAIALSIGLTAALNLWPRPGLRVEALALGFGLVHGFGFAGLMREAAAPDGLLPWALAGFNLGVEAGQLLAVAGWVLVVQWLVARPWYHRVVVRGGSVLLMGLSTAWFLQRVT